MLQPVAIDGFPLVQLVLTRVGPGKELASTLLDLSHVATSDCSQSLAKPECSDNFNPKGKG
jgi:hypothetical protein